MKYLLPLLLIGLFLAGCAGIPGGPAADIAVTYSVAKAVENSSDAARPVRIAQFREAADGLSALARGTVSRGAVETLLAKSLTGADLAAVRALLLTYFPDDGDVPVHHHPELAAAALRVARLIEAGLPVPSAK